MDQIQKANSALSSLERTTTLNTATEISLNPLVPEMHKKRLKVIVTYIYLYNDYLKLKYYSQCSIDNLDVGNYK